MFGRNAADIEFARLDQQQEHESFVRETVDIVEQEANTWEFAAQLDVAAGERLTQINVSGLLTASLALPTQM